MRLMEYNSVTQSKVVIDVKWSKLAGNSQAYLSTHIVALTLNSTSIYQNVEQLAKEWLVSHNTDKAIDMIRLIDNHVISQDGLDLYKNAYYFYELTRKHTFEKPIDTYLSNGLWSVDRLAIELNITVEEVESMVLYKIDKVEFAERLHENLLNNKEILDHLTAKYNIPTINC